MANHDVVYDKKVVNNNTKKIKSSDYQSKVNTDLKNQFASVKDTTTDDGDVKENDDDGDFLTEQPRNSHKKRKTDTITLEVPRKLLASPEIVSMIDRTQLSSRGSS